MCVSFSWQLSLWVASGTTRQLSSFSFQQVRSHREMPDPQLGSFSAYQVPWGCVCWLSALELQQSIWENEGKKKKKQVCRGRKSSQTSGKSKREKEWNLGYVYVSCSDGLAPVLPQTSHSVTAWGREFSFLLKLVCVFKHNLEFASGKLFKCDSIYSRTNYSSTSEPRESEVFILECIDRDYNK